MSTKVRGEARDTATLSIQQLPGQQLPVNAANGAATSASAPALAGNTASSVERRNTGNLAESALLNRELSWIEFNSRVLDEALDPTQPLLERLKFLAIFSTNLDEFFMVRVSGLQEQNEANPHLTSPDGLSVQ